jgi:Cryptococcal mannosyltransferase 1
MRYALVLFFVLTFLEVSHIHYTLSEPSTPYHDAPFSPAKTHRIYIASIHWNNELILRERWNDAVVELAEALGPNNVFVSVYESGSWDDTKGALRELDRRLGELNVPRNITLSDITHLDEISTPPTDEGWIETPRGKKELRRIPYLSRLRNISLRPLLELHSKGVEFDRIIFLNDVAFRVSRILLDKHL